MALEKRLTLPVLVFGMVELRRLSRELESLDEYLRQMAIRRQAKFEMPRSSRMLEALASDNQLDLLKGNERAALRTFLADTLAHAPSMHMSFAADPSAAFMAKLVTWLRANIHPLVLLEVGLQPTIAAGCIVRTNSKIFDLSLRSQFLKQNELLNAELQGVDKA